jgi:signal-transduction protein with cAMP-binding, CBS, and nucleotidyltransferase domain
VLVDSCGGSGVTYIILYWVADYPDTFRVSREVLTNALNFLDQAGISPVYPKTDITLFEPAQRHIDRRLDLIAILRRTPFFAGVEEQALQTIERGSQLREFLPEAIVVKEGDRGASLFLVVAGLLDVTKQIADEPVRRMGRLEPGAVFGEMSLLTGAARIATVTAITHATVLEIEKKQIEPIMAAHPELIAAFSQLIAEREAANESVLAAWPENSREIANLGLKAFVRAKIAHFFGQAP